MQKKVTKKVHISEKRGKIWDHFGISEKRGGKSKVARKKRHGK